MRVRDDDMIDSRGKKAQREQQVGTVVTSCRFERGVEHIYVGGRHRLMMKLNSAAASFEVT